MATVDRRRAPRVGYVAEAVVFCDERRLFCRTADLSATGMLILPSPSAAPSRHMTVDVNLPRMDGVRLNAELQREGQHEGRYCWGVSFRQVPTYVRAVLRDYVRQRLRGVPPEQMVFGVDQTRGVRRRRRSVAAGSGARLPRPAAAELRVTVGRRARANELTPAADLQHVATAAPPSPWEPAGLRGGQTKPATTRELRGAAERWGKG